MTKLRNGVNEKISEIREKTEELQGYLGLGLKNVKLYDVCCGGYHEIMEKIGRDDLNTDEYEEDALEAFLETEWECYTDILEEDGFELVHLNRTSSFAFVPRGATSTEKTLYFDLQYKERSVDYILDNFSCFSCCYSNTFVDFLNDDVSLYDVMTEYVNDYNYDMYYASDKEDNPFLEWLDDILYELDSFLDSMREINKKHEELDDYKVNQMTYFEGYLCEGWIPMIDEDNLCRYGYRYA